MSDFSFNPSSAPVPEPDPVESLGWLDIWGYSISKPSVNTFRELLEDPKSARSPYLWVGMASLLSYLISIGLQTLFGAPSFAALSSQFGDQLGPMGSMIGTASMMSLICCAPFIAFLGVLGFIISTGIYHLLAKLFGGTGTFKEMAFAASTFYVPLSVISAVLAALPVVGTFLVLPVSAYILVLYGVSINAVHSLGAGKATAVVLIPLVVVIVIGILLGVLMISTLAPMLEQMPGGVNPFTY